MKLNVISQLVKKTRYPNITRQKQNNGKTCPHEETIDCPGDCRDDCELSS